MPYYQQIGIWIQAVWPQSPSFLQLHHDFLADVSIESWYKNLKSIFFKTTTEVSVKMNQFLPYAQVASLVPMPPQHRKNITS